MLHKRPSLLSYHYKRGMCRKIPNNCAYSYKLRRKCILYAGNVYTGAVKPAQYSYSPFSLMQWLPFCPQRTCWLQFLCPLQPCMTLGSKSVLRICSQASSDNLRITRCPYSTQATCRDLTISKSSFQSPKYLARYLTPLL